MAETSSEISHELEKSHQARALGLEGRARVCARRAAGMAVRMYFKRRGFEAEVSNYYTLLEKLIEIEPLPQSAKASAKHLLLRVDENYHLPPEIDLIADAENLITALSREE